MNRPYLRAPNEAFAHWPRHMHEMIKVDINVTINMVDNKKLDEILALIKSENDAKLKTLEDRIEAQTEKLKDALKPGT